MPNPIDAIPAGPSASLPVVSDTYQESFYETSCGLCGSQIHFLHPLTGWTKVYCPGCGEYVSVR
jgi:predicted RNA-binding Zn-ribbon protein involved in translation (DUF1610 family)